MQINGSLKGDMKLKKAQYYPSTNKRMATVTLCVRLNLDEAKEHLGEMFQHVAEAALYEGDNGGGEKPVIKSIKPDFVLLDHTIQFSRLNWKGRCTPEIADVRPVQKESKVEIDIDLPLPIADTMKEFYGSLMTQLGTTQTIKFKVREPGLPNTGVDEPTVTKVPGPHGAPVPK